MITTNQGFEDVTAREVREILDVEATPRPFGILGRVVFEVKDILDAIKFAYITRTSNRVAVFLHHFEIPRDRSGLDVIYREVKSLDIDFLSKDKTFAIRTDRFGVHEFNSMDIMRVAGQAVIDNILESKGYRQKVNLDNPDVIIRVDVVGDHAMVGIDLIGEKSLHSRGYKVYHHPAALKSTLAHQLVMLSGWNPKKEILYDPMCGSGTIPIEAGIRVKNIPGGFWRKKNLQFIKLDLGIDWFDWMEEIDDSLIVEDPEIKGIMGSDKIPRHVRGAELNSQRALVRDIIRWSRLELEWLDVKLERNSIDLIVTNPPYGKKIGRGKEVENAYKYLFFQADWILTEEGRIVLISPRDELVRKYSEEYGFKIKEEKDAWNGGLKVKVYTIERAHP